MALGIPTVAAAAGASSEAISDGVNGFLAHDEESWLERLVKLIDNPGLRQQIGEAGRRTVEERYSKAACARRFAEVVRNATEAHGA